MALLTHLVGSVPLPDSESVFRTVTSALGPLLRSLPDGETGFRRIWIKFLQEKLAHHPAIEVAHDVPPMVFRQWDGTIVREIPRLRIKPGHAIDPAAIDSGYAQAAAASFAVFDRLQQGGLIPPRVKFQVCLPSPIAPAYNNMLPADRPPMIRALTDHLLAEVETITSTLPPDRLVLQWDVCQEVLAWEGYYEPGAVPFEDETIATLVEIGNTVSGSIEMGYHLCYGSPADEHLVQPKDAAVMVEIINRVAAGVARPIDFVHMPVPKPRTDDAFFAPMEHLDIDDAHVYLGLVHHRDEAGDDARMATARKHVRVDGVATECGWGRGDPDKVKGLLSSLARAASN